MKLQLQKRDFIKHFLNPKHIKPKSIPLSLLVFFTGFISLNLVMQGPHVSLLGYSVALGSLIGFCFLITQGRFVLLIHLKLLYLIACYYFQKNQDSPLSEFDFDHYSGMTFHVIVSLGVLLVRGFFLIITEFFKIVSHPLITLLAPLYLKMRTHFVKFEKWFGKKYLILLFLVEVLLLVFCFYQYIPWINRITIRQEKELIGKIPDPNFFTKTLEYLQTIKPVKMNDVTGSVPTLEELKDASAKTFKQIQLSDQLSEFSTVKKNIFVFFLILIWIVSLFLVFTELPRFSQIFSGLGIIIISLGFVKVTLGNGIELDLPNTSVEEASLFVKKVFVIAFCFFIFSLLGKYMTKKKMSISELYGLGPLGWVIATLLLAMI